MISPLEDEKNQSALLQQVALGNNAAFRQLFDSYYQRLYHVALYFLKNKELAEEAVADVFYNVWRKKENLASVADISNYLYKSVKNQSLHYIRRTRDADESIELYNIELIADNDNPETSIENKEYQHLLQQAINNLPPKCREVFRLVLSDKLTHKQIAQLLDISEKTVEAHVANAYNKIPGLVKSKYKETDSKNKIMFVFI